MIHIVQEFHYNNKTMLIIKNVIITLNKPYCTSKAARVMFSMKSLKIPPPSIPASSTPNSLTNDTRICMQKTEAIDPTQTRKNYKYIYNYKIQKREGGKRMGCFHEGKGKEKKKYTIYMH